MTCGRRFPASGAPAAAKPHGTGGKGDAHACGPVGAAGRRGRGLVTAAGPPPARRRSGTPGGSGSRCPSLRRSPPGSTENTACQSPGGAPPGACLLVCVPLSPCCDESHTGPRCRHALDPGQPQTEGHALPRARFCCLRVSSNAARALEGGPAPASFTWTQTSPLVRPGQKAAALFRDLKASHTPQRRRAQREARRRTTGQRLHDLH